MISRFVGRLGGALACALVAACSTSQPAAPSNTGPEELNYSRQMPTIAAGDLGTRGTVVRSSDQAPFDLSELPAGSTAHTMVYRSTSLVRPPWYPARYSHRRARHHPEDGP